MFTIREQDELLNKPERRDGELLRRGRRHFLATTRRRARTEAGLPQVRVHDLKHTFGRRLRAAGVSFEDRQDLLGQRSGRVTTHYSAVELESLIAAAERVCGENSRTGGIEAEGDERRSGNRLMRLRFFGRGERI